MSRSVRVILVAVALLAGTLRLAHHAELTRNDVLASVPAGDERTFVLWAHRVATGHDDTIPYQAPLYPTILGALERVTHAPPLAVTRLLQALLGLVTAGIAARLALELTGDGRAAVAAFFLTALARPLIHAEGTILREPASAALLVTLALAFVRARSRTATTEDHFGLGLALGLGLVLRENFAIVAAVVSVERTLALRKAGGMSARARTAALLALTLGAALPVLPFDLKVARLGGGPHALPHWNSGCVFYLGNRRDNASGGGYEKPPFVPQGNPEGEIAGFTAEAERQTQSKLSPHAVGDFWLREGLREIGADPLRFLGRVATRAFTSIVPWETVHQRDPTLDAESSWVLRAPLVDAGVLLALAFTGVIAVLARGPTRAERGVLILVAAWWVSMLAAAFTTRYRVPVLPLLAVLGALGARTIARLVSGRRWGRLVGVSVLVLVLVGGLRVLRPPVDLSNALRTRALAAMEAGSPAAEGSPYEPRWFKMAIPDLERSLALRPDLGTELLLGEAAFHAELPRRARAAYTEAARLDPRCVAAWRELGRVELVTHRPHAALAAFEKARALTPDDLSLAKAARLAEKQATHPDAPP